MKHIPLLDYKSLLHRWLARWAWAAVFMLGGGCQNPQSVPVAETEQAGQEKLIRYLRPLPTVTSIEGWDLPAEVQAEPRTGLIIKTAHYEIYTTLQDPLILRQVPVFLESAYRSYGQVFGQELEIERRLAIYFFHNRLQWEEFTRYWTGPAAEVYMQIRAGAYYLDKACVAYHLGRQSNFAVLAHEGWHQFSDAVFAYRLPAWADEGLATSFESYQWEDGKVRFDPRRNGMRLRDLQKALAAGKWMGLGELLAMDAGRVLSFANKDPGGDAGRMVSITGYYAQLYALVRFLREDEYGRRLLSFRNMLNDGRLGNWPLPEELRAEAVGRKQNPSRRWNAMTGTLIFQSYIAAEPGSLEKQYQLFCRKIVRNISRENKL